MLKSLMKFLAVGVACGALIASGEAASAAGFWTNGMPPAGGTQYPSTIPLTGNEGIPADTMLTNGQNPASEYITVNQIEQFGNGLPTNYNAIVGGVADTNLFQKCSTTQTGVTTTYTYGCADDWAIWAAGDTIKLLKDTTAGDIPTGFNSTYKFTKTTNSAGGQECMAQVVESKAMLGFQGTTAELDFHAYLGALSTATTSLTAYIVTGTSADEGMQKLAYQVNAGGGGGSGWTGGANATVALFPTLSVSTAYRLAAFANIPTTAKELGVAICWTSTNATAGATDYISLTGIQLVRSPANASYVSATAGYVNGVAGSPQFSSVVRKTPAQDAADQLRYYQVVAESATADTIQSSAGISSSTSVCTLGWPLDVPMRVAPTLDTTVPGGAYNALAATTFALHYMGDAGTAIVLATPFMSIPTGGSGTTTNLVNLAVKTAASQTAWQGCAMESAHTTAGGGAFAFNAQE